MGTETNHKEERNTPEYLAQLLKDKKQMQAFPNVFLHAERLIDEEINKVRVSLFHINVQKDPMALPEADGATISVSEKVFVPVKDYPDFNFVGRILGPRGITIKQLEQETQCKIMVRGKGSMRDKVKEEMNRGKPNWEHLNEELHVLIMVEDSKNRAEVKLKRAIDEVKKLLVPAPEGEDELKKMQLMELAIMNGTYRDGKAAIAVAHSGEWLTGVPGHTWQTKLGQDLFNGGAQRMMSPHLALPPQLRSPTPGGAPIILAQRMPTLSTQTMTSTASLLNGGPPPLMTPAEAGLMYPYEYPYGLAPALLEYPTAQMEQNAGAVPKRRAMGVREHPYSRVSLA